MVYEVQHGDTQREHTSSSNFIVSVLFDRT